MKTVQIQAKPFFDMLKEKDQSMWDVFAQLINGENQQLVFINEDKTILFDYILPKNHTELQLQQQKFAEAFKDKMMSLYN